MTIFASVSVATVCIAVHGKNEPHAWIYDVLDCLSELVVSVTVSYFLLVVETMISSLSNGFELLNQYIYDVG